MRILPHSEIYREDLTIDILAEIFIVTTRFAHLLDGKYIIDLTIQNN